MLVDNEKNEIKNSNELSSLESRISYKLYFDEGTDGKIRMFCEVFNIELNNFIVNTVKSYLYEIGNDLGDGDYDTIGKYYAVSKLVGVQPRNMPHKEPEKNIKVEAEFHHLISEAIEYVCDEIPKTPEKFIVDIINGEIDILIDIVKEGGYDFLATYKNFSKIVKSIQRIHEEDPL